MPGAIGTLQLLYFNLIRSLRIIFPNLDLNIEISTKGNWLAKMLKRLYSVIVSNNSVWYCLVVVFF